MQDSIRRLREAREAVLQGGGKDRIARLHEKGKLTARERIDHLLDPGSFVEFSMFTGLMAKAPGDGVVTGHGAIDGRTVCVYSQDSTVLGGSVGYLHGTKLYRTVERALDMGVPLIGLNDSPGRRVEKVGEGGAPPIPESPKSGSAMLYPITQASGVIPQLSAVLGSCAGLAAYGPALTDFVFMVEGISQMFITGPRVIKSVTGEDVTFEDLGGARVHCQISGVSDFLMLSEEECFQTMRKLLSFLPSNHLQEPPIVDTGDSADRLDDILEEIVPADGRKGYDMHRVIEVLADNGDFLEVKAEFAAELIVGFARLNGRPVGFVANQPMVRSGALTVDSSDKQARFIRFCDAFNIPLVLLVDTPAYFPGVEQEHMGIIRHGAKVLYALCEAVVPRIAILMRKCYGGGNLGMGLVAALGTDFVFAWPIAELGTMGAEQSVELIYADEIRKADNPAEFRAQKIKDFREKYASPLADASAGGRIEDVIEPRETRQRLIRALDLMKGKRRRGYPKRHGNMPL